MQMFKTDNTTAVHKEKVTRCQKNVLASLCPMNKLLNKSWSQ